MNITPKAYAEMSREASPKSNSKVNLTVAFMVGGAVCALGQLIMNALESTGADHSEAGTWTSIILVALSAFLTGIGWYSRLAKHAGAGTLVPITGFANAVSSCALEAKSEGLILGVGAKIFTIAGPVILYGCFASALYGLFYYIFGAF